MPLSLLPKPFRSEPAILNAVERLTRSAMQAFSDWDNAMVDHADLAAHVRRELPTIANQLTDGVTDSLVFRACDAAGIATAVASRPHDYPYDFDDFWYALERRDVEDAADAFLDYLGGVLHAGGVTRLVPPARWSTVLQHDLCQAAAQPDEDWYRVANDIVICAARTLALLLDT